LVTDLVVLEFEKYLCSKYLAFFVWVSRLSE
jgi:hypothetical protein